MLPLNIQLDKRKISNKIVGIFSNLDESMIFVCMGIVTLTSKGKEFIVHKKEKVLILNEKRLLIKHYILIKQIQYYLKLLEYHEI